LELLNGRGRHQMRLQKSSKVTSVIKQNNEEL
jgi:hypothetical protein